jgi:hypothetical protein
MNLADQAPLAPPHNLKHYYVKVNVMLLYIIGKRVKTEKNVVRKSTITEFNTNGRRRGNLAIFQGSF